MAHLVPVEPGLPLAQPLAQQVELLGMKPPVLAADLERVGLVGPEEPEAQFSRKRPVPVSLDVAVLLELAVRQPGGAFSVGILKEAAEPRLDLALDVPSADLGLRLGLCRRHVGPGQDRQRREEESMPFLAFALAAPYRVNLKPAG